MPMNYRRVMRISPPTKATALLVGVVLVLSGCGAEGNAPPAAAAPCEIVANGTPAPKSPASAVPSSAAAPSTSRNISTNPEVATGYRKDMTAVRTSHYAVATANPLATQKACEVLRDGGTAADALVTAQAVLGLVEPQSSGIGGGGFLLYYDASSGGVQAYDGREVAPAAATENYLRWISDTDRTEPKPDARASGRSIGVPGILALLQEVHAEHGKTAWRELFDPAVSLADNGFDVSPRLAAAIADSAPELNVDANASAYFLNADGSPKSAGTRLTNPAYSKTLGVIASDPKSFYTGDVAHSIVAAAADASGGRTPSLITVEDLSGYAVKKREPLCTPYRGKEICGMPPPSSGGIAVASTLGVLEHLAMADHKPTDVDLNGGRPSVMGVHLVSEAERLAYADRDKYVADTDFVPLPGGTRRTDLRAAHHGHREAWRLRTADHARAAHSRARHQPDQRRRRAGQRGVTDHHRGVGVRVVSHGGRIHSEQPAHRLLHGASGSRRSAGGEPGPAGQAATQLDGADADVRIGSGRCKGSAVRGTGLTRWLGDHPVRGENYCGHRGLGPRSAAGGIGRRLRSGELAEDQRRR
jgi:gamma-glutamyltranspeptidase/glutathione hydrolase